MKDTLVIDIETSNTFADVGRENFDALNISVIGAYSYDRDEFMIFDENELDKLGELMREAGLIVGFASKRFDLPVMRRYYNFDLFAIPHLDILDEIELSSGKRISLDVLAKENLGYGKIGKGSDAPILYEQGKIDELKEYCLHDVKVTKEVYDLAKTQGHLMVPQRNEDPLKVNFEWGEKLLYQRLF
jgi:DEAD/DEAH box helicase domain-containing protein